MKKLIAILLCVLMLCVAGCADNDIEFEPTEYEPETTIDPSTVDFGYDEKTDSYDRWYLTNTDDVTYIYFSYDNKGSFDNCVGTYHLVKSGVVANSAALCASSDNHLNPALSSAAFVDFVFEDYFTVYDYSSGNRYSRGNIDEYNSYFADKTYAMENKQYAITFNSDSSCTKTDSENEFSGTWEIVSKSKVKCTFLKGDILFDIVYNDDYSVNSIVSNDDVLYPEIIEDETVNKYKTY